MLGRFDLKKLQRFDGYYKPLDDIRIRTLSGGCVSIIAGAIMTLLFFNELRYYLTTELNQQIVVDSSHEDKIPIYIDITFHRMGCLLLTMDTMASTGNYQLSVDHSLFHTRLKENGEPLGPPEKYTTPEAPPEAKAKRAKSDYCGSCYGAESERLKCCNTCEEVRSAYQAKGWVLNDLSVIEQCRDEGMPAMLASAEQEGCRFTGVLTVEKVVGSFHFAPGRSYQSSAGTMHIHDIASLHTKSYNMSHTINKLAFGETFPSMVNPLDGTVVSTESMSERHTYHVKIVPTSFTKLDQTVVESNQYSVTKERKNFMFGGGVPGIFVNYEFSPISVRLQEVQRSFLHFLTNVCAIVGGVFTVFSLIDAGLFHLSKIQRSE